MLAAGPASEPSGDNLVAALASCPPPSSSSDVVTVLEAPGGRPLGLGVLVAASTPAPPSPPPTTSEGGFADAAAGAGGEGGGSAGGGGVDWLGWGTEAWDHQTGFSIGVTPDKLRPAIFSISSPCQGGRCKATWHRS